MNENIDLTKILKDCPKGWKLYSPIGGEVEFSAIEESNIYSINVRCQKRKFTFSREGYYYLEVEDAECILFPSKDQRDWSKFTAPWYKKEKFDPKTLKAFDRVLVRDSDNESWCCDLFSHIKEENIGYKYVASGFFLYRCCIPYNDETKHLVGTAEEAPEYYRYWEDWACRC